jgi:hypothetical protein
MKDFGQTIPGHGGVTDRFDCQMIMAMFAYLYYWNYVAVSQLSVGDALEVRGRGRWCSARVAAGSLRAVVRCRGVRAHACRHKCTHLHMQAQVALKLEQQQQLELWARLGNMLLGEGLLEPSLEDSLAAVMERASHNPSSGRLLT